jgi:Protein of unknown function (DUF3383)
MPSLLSVSDIVNVQVQMAPIAAQVRNFGSCLILGDTDVIDTFQRYRLYSSLQAVGSDLGSNSPEYQGAQVFFAQSPQVSQCYIGRWASTATHGTLRGAPLSVASQAIGNFTGILNGGVNFTIDGVAKNLTGLNFSGQTNLNGVAAVIQSAFAGSANVTWDSVNGQFVVKSSSTGNSSSVSFGSTGAGVDVSLLLGVGSQQGGYTVAGIPAETIESAVNTFLSLTNAWYGLALATTVAISDADLVQVAGIIEASSPSHIFGVTSSENPLSTSDLATLLQAGGYSRTFCQYSSSFPYGPYAAISALGKAFGVNFNGSNTTLTLKFKQEPLLTGENLTETQAAALKGKNSNVYANYNITPPIAILQEGTMANGFFFDEVHNADWLQNALQTAVWNALYTSPTKIPLTDAGVAQLTSVIAGIMSQSVANGMVAPGVWTGPPIGNLKNGDTLTTGFYIYAPPVSTLSTAARVARQSPVIQIAAKLAGAIHYANLLVSVNR